jgi:hypothetical protein
MPKQTACAERSRHERTEAHKDTRAGSYQRQLHTKVGEVSLKVPRLRTLPFDEGKILALENAWNHALEAKDSTQSAPPSVRLTPHFLFILLIWLPPSVRRVSVTLNRARTCRQPCINGPGDDL